MNVPFWLIVATYLALLIAALAGPVVLAIGFWAGCTFTHRKQAGLSPAPPLNMGPKVQVSTSEPKPKVAPRLRA